MMPTEISPRELELRVDLACLFRINAHLGWEDSINTHSTIRVPGPEHHFLINPFGLRLGEVKASDLIKIDLDGNVIGESTHPVNRAGYVIHSAIHMGRADAKCVIHTHSLPGMAVAAAAEGLVEHNIFALGFHVYPITSSRAPAAITTPASASVSPPASGRPTRR
jgi:ribulose-5-phosphate 4-epimerase/fuculose-1-phosphate aldolase